MFTPRHSVSIQASIFLAALHLLLLAGGISAQNVAPTPSQPLSAPQIVDQMQHHNKIRADDLKHYQSLRHYEVQYKGFSATIDAKMAVEADYDAVSGKSFRIVSQTGSKFLVDKVLKRLLDTEKEAGSDQKSTALTPQNYKFQLDGNEIVDGRPSYILDVEPLVASKYLYRGKIWVDAADFAVAKIEASPAKNPSFWISSTAIHHRYIKTEGFWLPEQNRSETRVRVGGTAVLTIDYGAYHVVPETTVPGGY